MRGVMISEEDYPVWNGYLYQLQQEAPRPTAVRCRNPDVRHGRPSYFGDECHGAISREEGDNLCQEEGSFLVRESRAERGRYTLVLRILGVVKNFKLYWEDGQHFVGDKRFNNVYDLVEDGLITMYVEEKAHDYIQNMSNNKSVYCSLTRTKQLLSRHLSSDNVDPRLQMTEPRMAPNSPRYAHNGRNTEEAALPYSTPYHHPADFRPQMQYHNPTYVRSPLSEEEKITEALQNKLNTKSRGDAQNYYQQSAQQGCNMIQSLMNEGHAYPSVNYQMLPREPHSVGGTKKTLTPTSSDERKRTKAKKIATEEAISQQSLDQRYNPPMHVRNHSPMTGYDLRRSPSNSSASASDGEGRKPFAKPSPNFQSSRNHEPPYHCSLAALHHQTNVAHVRQLSGGSTSGSSVTSGSNVALPTPLPRNTAAEKSALDANDNQIPETGTRRSHAHHSPCRQSPVRGGYSGHDVIPATTFDQLKDFQRLLEQASEDEMRNEAKDELATLNMQRKPRLTRSNTTANAPLSRPSSGRAPPRPTPRDAHARQRSEPVELFQNLATRKAGSQNDGVPVTETLFHRHQHLREEFRQQIPRQNGEAPNGTTEQQSIISQLRVGGSGSCSSSASNVSSISGSTSHHTHEIELRNHDTLSHVSSEDWTGEERESSPSPHSTGKRSCGSDDNFVPTTGCRGAHVAPRSTAVVPPSCEMLWQQKPVAGDVRFAGDESNDVISALPLTSQGAKEHPRYRRTKSEATLSGLANKTNIKSFSSSMNDAQRLNRKHSDSDISSPTRQEQANKARHHSETSSEEGTPRPQEPLSPTTGLHKPLQRRATTGSDSVHKKEIGRQLSKVNGHASPTRFTKKPAQRSNSGPSPRKGKKSPEGLMSPRLQHIHHQRSLSSPRIDGVPYYDKEHVFKSHTYRGLQWCEYCGNFMWGIIQQGMQCRDCGLNVHKQCSKLVPGDCQPAFKHVKKVFGIDLTALVKLHGTERPIVVDKCIEEIEKRGMDSEGIYRLCGSHDDVQELKLNFDRYGDKVSLASTEDINIISSGLKLYLRELPVPLIPYNLYSRFINAAKLSHGDGKLAAIRTAIGMMPPAHLQTLKHIVHHLTCICQHPENQMNSENLGIVFGPTMLRPPEKEASQARFNLNDAQYQKEIVETMIENERLLFGPRPELTTIRETHNL